MTHDLPSEQALEKSTALFRVLSDASRLRLLLTLAGGETNVSRLVALLGLPQPTVSHHLGLLRLHGLISNRRVGKEIYYSLVDRLLNADDALFTFAAGGFVISMKPARGPLEPPKLGEFSGSGLS